MFLISLGSSPMVLLNVRIWAAWVAQQFRACLQPRVWSWGPGIESRIGLPAWSLLLPLPVFLPLTVSLMNK